MRLRVKTRWSRLTIFINQNETDPVIYYTLTLEQNTPYKVDRKGDKVENAMYQNSTD